MLLKKLGLPENTTFAFCPTTCNGKSLSEETENEIVSDGFSIWRLGHKLQFLPNQSFVGKDVHSFSTKVYSWTTWTIENRTHVKNFECKVTEDGKLISGQINCFMLGWMELDQEYIDELLMQIEEQEFKWEKIE